MGSRGPKASSCLHRLCLSSGALDPFCPHEDIPQLRHVRLPQGPLRRSASFPIRVLLSPALSPELRFGRGLTAMSAPRSWAKLASVRLGLPFTDEEIGAFEGFYPLPRVTRWGGDSLNLCPIHLTPPFTHPLSAVPNRWLPSLA